MKMRHGFGDAIDSVGAVFGTEHSHMDNLLFLYGHVLGVRRSLLLHETANSVKLRYSEHLRNSAGHSTVPNMDVCIWKKSDKSGKVRIRKIYMGEEPRRVR